MKIKNAAVSTRLTTVTSMVALAAPFWAAARSPSPGFRLKNAAPPLPIIIARASATMVIGKTTLVAPLPRYPTPQPMKIWPTMLYRELTGSAITLGTANRAIRRPIGSVANGLCFSFSAVFSIGITFSK